MLTAVRSPSYHHRKPGNISGYLLTAWVSAAVRFCSGRRSTRANSSNRTQASRVQTSGYPPIKDRRDAVAGVFGAAAAVAFNQLLKDLVVPGDGGAHLVRVIFP
jgi:hypothetical protein